MVLVSVRLLVALAVCLVGTNKYGLVGADLVGCRAKCTGSDSGDCNTGCAYIFGGYRTKASCDDQCFLQNNVSTTLDAPRCSWRGYTVHCRLYVTVIMV